MSACCKKCNLDNFFVYFSHFLSAWGDRMWAFGVGLFLINISSDSLQLTAVYGLSMSLSVLLFGALVGDIVDETPRLKAAQIALVLQNLFVIICAVLIYFFLAYMKDIMLVGDWMRYTAYVLIILLCVLSRLTSMARQIAVEKDWIVEMCGNDKDRLASMTASLRRIDLSTQVLAPMATGFIMAMAGVEFGAVFIGSWNFVSVFIEYYFLWKVYNTVPALKKKKDLKKSQALTEAETSKTEDVKPNEEGKKEEELTLDHEQVEIATIDEKIDAKEEPNNQQPFLNQDEKKKAKKKCSLARIFNSLERLYLGWPVYARYGVRNAGLALACLYMTVLGFDSITVGYAKTQGVSELLVGIMMALAASFGIFGTFMYPFMRRRLGLARTGIFGLSLQITCLILCVVSVWMPGSKFDLSLGSSSSNTTIKVESNCSEPITLDRNKTLHCSNEALNLKDNVSIWMLLAGIITARFGLWVADLTISQLFMESVAEKERGKVNGVQSSLNQLMDMLKYLMVVLAPHDHQFGLLILISFCFICIAWLLYAFFLKKERNHFFHFQTCVIKNNQAMNS